MYAIVSTGGKQYKVANGDILRVELLSANEGDKINLDVVMLVKDGEVVADKNAKVVAEVIFNGRGKKINIFKYKAKKNVRKRQGHRQPFSKIKIVEIA